MAGDEQAVRGEILAAFGALLKDRDVGGAHLLEGGSLEVQRRGRRERLDAGVDDSFWQALRAAGAGDGPVSIEVEGHRLNAAPVGDGRLLVHLQKAPRTDIRVDDLVDEGLLPQAGANEILRVAQAGNGLVVVGSARAAARRLAIAVARELAEHAPVMALVGIGADWLLPAPDVRGGIAARARVAVELGAEVLLAVELTLADSIMLAREQLPVPIVGAVDVAGYAALYAAFTRAEGEPSVDSLASQVCVVGRSSSGAAVLLEQHAPDVGAPQLSTASLPARLAAPASPAQRTSSPARPAEPEIVDGHRALPPARPMMAPVDELPPLPPLGDGPPAHWASSDVSEDPGWELGPAQLDAAAASPARGGDDAEEAYDDEAGESSAFDNILNRAQQERPSFQPRPPAMHPQARQLQEEMLPGGDPLGGLTLEPPPGGEVARAELSEDGLAGEGLAGEGLDDEGRE